jgi:hypothetical protein
MLDRQSREVRICGEIACGLTRNKQVFQDRPVALGWSNDPHVRAIQPALDPVNGLFHAQGSLEYPSIGGDADESEDYRPSSPSSCDRSSCTLSRLSPSRNPMSWGTVLYGRRADASPIRSNPARSASFTIVRNGFRSFRADSRARSRRSSSRAIVVRIRHHSILQNDVKAS